ncbi:lamin tail domain-containing protein [Streptomyces sp. NPDC059690]|uniref:lamin tail domain-containing protein n=1 Tax=Streptomyces sp. NPDC059690 TaxID=3346907 RepID=UPI00369F939C
MSVSASVRRLTAAAAVAAAVVGSAALPAAAADHRPGFGYHDSVFISAVHHASPWRDGRSNRSLNAEWADITNDSRRAVNLDHWTLSDRQGHTYTFHHVLLQGRATVRVHTGLGRDTGSDVYQDRRDYVWDRSSDTATLRDERGRLVDETTWGRHDRDGGRRDGDSRHGWGGRHDRDGWHDRDGRHGGDHRR